MMRLCLVALLSTLLLAVTDPAGAQNAPADADTTVTGRTAAEAPPAEEALTYDDLTVKAYSLSFYGGWFSGGNFLDLPPIDGERTFVEQGSDRVMGYDGEWLDLDPALYDAVQKDIKSGPSFGGKLGIFLSADFHLDLSVSMSKGKAITTMRNKSDPENTFREQVDEDDGFSLLLGGANLVYDSNSFSIFGARPFVGFGLGGVINSFTYLEDATGLYFQGVAGLNVHLTRSLSVVGQYQLTTFSFSRAELEYAKQVTYSNAFIGLSWYIDVLPPEVRASQEAARAEG